MQVLWQVRRARHPAVPVNAVIAIAVRAFFITVKIAMIIAVKARVASTALVEHHVVKAIQSALWRMVRLADQLRVIAGVSQLQEAWPDILARRYPSSSAARGSTGPFPL